MSRVFQSRPLVGLRSKTSLNRYRSEAAGAPDQNVATTQVKRVRISRPFRANHLFGWYPGLKTWAESFSPFGAKTIPNSACSILDVLGQQMVQIPFTHSRGPLRYALRFIMAQQDRTNCQALNPP